MPYKTLEEVEALAGLTGYTRVQHEAYRLAYNTAEVDTMRTTNDISEAVIVASKAGCEADAGAHKAFVKTHLEGYAKKLTIGFYGEKSEKVYEGTAIWYYICEETWKTYICDGPLLLAILSGWESIDFEY